MMEKLYILLEKAARPEFMTEQKIYGKIGEFISQEMRGEALPPASPLTYEQTAFAFMEGETPIPSEWGDTFYRPLGGKIDPLGKWLHAYPDIKNITLEMIKYWEKRAFEAKNPVLICRYAGLAWDFARNIRGQKPNISLAHRFIDSIIEQARLGGAPFLKHKLRRGLKLAVRINDRKRIFSLRDSIINYENSHSEDSKPGTWGYAYDFLIGDRNLYQKAQLKKRQEDKIIKELERKLKVFSDKGSGAFEPHFVEHIITKLAPYYKGKNDRENMKRVLLIYRDSFLHGIKNNSVMAGSHWLERVRTVLFQHGLSEEAKRLEAKMRALQKEDFLDLQKHEITSPFPKEAMDRCIKTLDSQNLSEALATIARSFIPEKEQAKNVILKTAQEQPLPALISQTIMDYTGRKVAEVGPLKDDLEGHIALQISRSIHFYRLLINLSLEHIEKTKSLNADLLSRNLFQSPVFPEENHQIIKAGLEAYFNKNYIACCSILIAQIEAAVRELISIRGGEIYQPANFSEERGFALKSLGALLRDPKFIKVFEKFNPNVPDYFQILLTDKRGINLRNHICHGFLPSAGFHKQTAVSIIHVLLVLSLLRLTPASKQQSAL